MAGKTQVIIALAIIAVSCGRTRVKERPQASIPDSVYLESGNRFVAMTFDTLRNALFRSIELHGVDSAISFCNENALKITALYADSGTVRRTALRYRNPLNRPDSLEKRVVEDLAEALATSGSATERLIRSDDEEIHFFKPIIMQPSCVVCHGAPGKEISSSTMTAIRARYPADSAVNFMAGDLRGVWHVVFKTK